MVMINEEGDRATGIISNGGGDDHHHQHLQEDLYDKDFPPGYRFQPTDQELIKVYLFRKVNAFQLPSNRFEVANVYSCNPWELAATYESYGERIHYFFTPREKKYPNGHRPNRAAGVGYWKACGADRPICDKLTNEIIGYKRALVFYRGKPAKGEHEKTNWIMHEYTLEKPEEKERKKKKNDTTSSSNNYNSTASRRKNMKNKKLLCPNPGSPKNKQLDEFVLCKLYLKPGKSTQYPDGPDGDPFDEDITQENDTDVAAPSASMATATTSAAAVHQYPSTSMVVGVAAEVEEMVPVNCHLPHMHQSVVAATPVDHQSSLTSMVIAPATQEEMIPFSNCNYSDDINPSSTVSSSAILPSINQYYHGKNVWDMLGDQWINDI